MTAADKTVTEYGVRWPYGETEAYESRQRAEWVSSIHGHGHRLVVTRTVTYGPWQAADEAPQAKASADDGSPIVNMPLGDALAWLREVSESKCGNQRYDDRAWAAARVLLSEIEDMRGRLVQQSQIMREQGAELRDAEDEAYAAWQAGR